MDLDTLDGATSPFITLDACDGDLARRIVSALDASAAGDNQPWSGLVNNTPTLMQRLIEQGVKTPVNRTAIPWDDPTLLFTSCVVLTKEGQTVPLGDVKARERVGRFPHGDGSSISYMIEHMRPNNQGSAISQRMGMDEILILLEQLNSGLSDKHVGNSRYNEGTSLRRGLAGRGWSVTADEPIDGGMRDASKNLIAVLRAAERRDVGMFLRSHA
jgi:hypothetical protein